MLYDDVEANPYEGFVWGEIYNGMVRTSNNDILTTPKGYKGSFLCPLTPITVGHTYKYFYHPTYVPKQYHDSDFGQQSYAVIKYNKASMSSIVLYGGGDRVSGKITITISNANATHLRVCGTIENLDDFYLYDATDGVYIYKGKNVTADTQ